jgi:hypothetical protein
MVCESQLTNRRELRDQADTWARPGVPGSDSPSPGSPRSRFLGFTEGVRNITAATTVRPLGMARGCFWRIVGPMRFFGGDGAGMRDRGALRN